MACAMRMTVALMFAVAVAQGNQCRSGRGCTNQDESNEVSLIQTRLQMNAFEHGGEEVKSAWRTPEDLVNVLAGTDTQDKWSRSNGNTLPQIKMPWGFNDWAPQTDGYGGSWYFHRNDTKFQGMRCTHQPSPWIGDYGHFLLQPHLGAEPQDLQFSSKEAVFRPYLFNATLEGIGFEFVPTSHAAIVRMTFPSSAQAGHVSLSIGTGKLSVEDGKIRGYTTDNQGGVPEDWEGMFFAVEAIFGTHWERLPTHKTGQKLGTLRFRNDQGPIVIALATSFISQEQADVNLKQEIGSKSFSEVLAEGQAKWAEQLGRVRIDAVDETQLTVFYTNLWKSMLFPRYLQEVNLQGEEVHRSPYTGDVRSGKLVADSGFWDSYRSVYQLQSLVFSENLGSQINGWVNGYKENGWLPEWASPGEHPSMVGTMGDVVLADAIAKTKWGFLEGFDVDLAYDAIKKDAFVDPEGHFGRAGLREYIEKGYVTDRASDSVARSLNYYESDAAIARAARLLGHHEDAEALAARSQRYPLLFNKDTNFFQPKNAGGRFRDYFVDQGKGIAHGFDPLDWGGGFTEGGAWQYRFSVPQDVDGLNKLFNGNLCGAIQAMMSQTSGEPFHQGSYRDVTHEMVELAAIQKEFGLYAHGNQPVHHILFLAKKAGCNTIADKYLRKVVQDLYTIDGWAGDEDNGEMAAWYILSALGLYQLEGAKDELVLGSPAVKHATMALPHKKVLEISTVNQAATHVYVQSVKWTPEFGSQSHTITDNVLKFTELMRGGSLTFTMGPTPKP